MTSVAPLSTGPHDSLHGTRSDRAGPALYASEYTPDERTEDGFDMDDLDLDPSPVPGLSDETSSSSSAPSSTHTSPAVVASTGSIAVDEPSALSLPPAVKSLHTFHFDYNYSIPSRRDPPSTFAQSLPHNFSLNQTSSVETIKLNRRLLSPRLNPTTASPRLYPAQPPSIPPVFEDDADTSGEFAPVPLSRRCSRPGCAIPHAHSVAGLLSSNRRSSAPQVPRMVAAGRTSRLGADEPAVPSSSPADDEVDEPNHSAFGSYLFRAARPASPPTPVAPASTQVAPTPSRPPSILNTTGGVSTGGIGVRPVRFLFIRRTSPSASTSEPMERGRSAHRERLSGAATVRSPSPKARAGASGSRSRSRGVAPESNRRRSHA